MRKKRKNQWKYKPLKTINDIRSSLNSRCYWWGALFKAIQRIKELLLYVYAVVKTANVVISRCLFSFVFFCFCWCCCFAFVDVIVFFFMRMARNYFRVRAARAARFHQSTNEILNFVMSFPLPSWTLQVHVLKRANNFLPSPTQLSPFAELLSHSV